MPETKAKENERIYPIPLSPIMDVLNISLDLRIEDSPLSAMLLVKRKGETTEALLLNTKGAGVLRDHLTTLLRRGDKAKTKK